MTIIRLQNQEKIMVIKLKKPVTKSKKSTQPNNDNRRKVTANSDAVASKVL